MADHRIIPVPDGLDGERVDTVLARLFGLSRTRAARLADDGAAQLDARPVGRSDRVRAGAILEVALPSLREPDAEQTAEPAADLVPGMTIVYDDDDIVVVDKPVGVAAHSSVGWTGPTVLAGLRAAGYRISTSGASERQGIVSRLDVGTSGLMVVCKSEVAYAVMKRAFKTRLVDKTYHALVQGLPDPVVGTIDAPIGRHPAYDYKYAVMNSGKAAVTHYEVIEAFGPASLVAAHLETGRTHQIRVHFAALRHPCVGDPLYGSDPVLARRLGLDRQWLHAVGLAFEHPTSGEWVSFESPYPPDLQAALDVLSG